MHLIIKCTAMTNKEITKASLLDIIFNNRNKDYGAYALRREYPVRMLIALASTLFLIFLIFLLSSFTSDRKSELNNKPDEHLFVVKTFELLPDKLKEPEIQKSKPAYKQPAASITFSSQIKIVDDLKLKTTDVPEVTDLIDNDIATITRQGPKRDSQFIPFIPAPKNDGNGIFDETPAPDKTIIFSQSNPEFPGGEDALMRFFERNLNTPDELDGGNKKMVQVRFRINKDGVVSSLEIFKSGGEAFDKEVIRVCNKMPRWKPATQNGIQVPVTFVLPVTFIAYDQ